MADDALSFIVISVFILLFLIFINTQAENSGSAILDDVGVNTITIFVAIVVVIVVLGIIFLIFRRIKKKKILNIPVAPKPSNSEQDYQLNMDMPSPSPNKTGESGVSTHETTENGRLNEEELSSLFKEAPVNENKQNIAEKTEVRKEFPEIQIAPKKEDKTLANLTELKNLISKLINKKYSREQIVNFLQSKGWNASQINKATEELNTENLRYYIKEARRMNMNNDAIIKSLIDNGWKIDLIKRILST